MVNGTGLVSGTSPNRDNRIRASEQEAEGDSKPRSHIMLWPAYPTSGIVTVCFVPRPLGWICDSCEHSPLHSILDLPSTPYPNDRMSDPKAMASSSAPALPSVVRYILTLPRELVHKILDNLCISQVLSLSLHNIPYIEECILGQFHYKRLFPKPDQLRKLSEYYRLYKTILHSLCISPHKHTTKLSVHPAWSGITYGELVTRVHAEIFHLINRVTPRMADLAVLSALSPTPLHAVWDSSTLPLLQSRWTSLSETTKVLNVKKSEQLLKLRALVFEYPNILRAGLNNQGYKNSLIHITDYLDLHAKQLLRPRNELGKKRAYTFKHGLPVLPDDRYLRLFLKVIERYPLPDEDMPGITPPGGKVPTYEDSLGKLLDTPKISADIKAQLDHRYTPEAIENIRRVILGLTYCYTSTSTSPVPPGLTWPPTTIPALATVKGGTVFMTFGSRTPDEIGKGKEIPAPPQEPINMRTKQTPYSAYPYNKSYGLSQPCFVLPNQMEAYAPLADMEIQWLESFLWSCKYMANMRDAMWNENLSVGEMWCKKSQHT